MSESLLREIAEQVVREQILTNWLFWLVLAGVALLTSVLSAFLVSYVRRRAETYATKSDLAELVAQLKATTTVAEQVRTAIAHADWSHREWKTLRRTKLEELLATVSDVYHWLDKDLSARFFHGNQSTDKPPIWRLQLVSRLYFPELFHESQKLTSVFNQYTLWMIDVQTELVAAEGDTARRDAILEGAREGLRTHHRALVDAISAIDEKAPLVLLEILGGGHTEN